MTRLAIMSCLVALIGVDVSSAQDVARPCSPATLFEWYDTPSVEYELGGLVTDRPDFTEASSTVGAGVVQLETGYTYIYDDDGTTQKRIHSWGEPLLRIGLLENWFEFRFAMFPISRTETTANRRTGSDALEDIYVGAKIALTPQCGLLPETAILPQFIAPTGGIGFTPRTPLWGVNYLYSWELNELYSLGGSTQFNRALDDSGREFTAWAQSVSLSRSLTENVGSYAEFFAFFPTGADTALPEYYFNGGFAWLLTDDIQFDVRAGMGLNDNAEDFFTGTGLTFRFH